MPPLSDPSANGATPFVAQPCLVLGGGGVGHRIVLNLKAQLVSIYGQVPAGIRLMAFDIDEESLAVRAGRRLVTLERDTEIFCIGPVPVARIKQNLDKFPSIRDRLPSLESIPPIAAAHAAKQQRPIGQLAFQWQFPRIRTLLQETLWQLAGRNQRGDDHLMVDPGRGLKIIQVGSNCGGTNAGSFIDFGFLLRHELNALGLLGDSCTVIGIGMLPGAFRGVAGPNLAPNTVASLLELEAVTLNGHQQLVYRDATVVDTTRPPFDMYLLVDAVDETGRVWVNHDDLCRMVARATLVLAASRLGEQGEGELDNLGDILSERTVDGHGTFFGSLGLSVLEFPARTLVDVFAARQGQTVIGQGLLRPVKRQAAEDEARAWLQAQRLSPDALRDVLARDDAGLPLAVAVELPGSLRRLPDAQAPQEVLQFVQAYARMRVDGDFHAELRRQAQALSARASQQLEADIQVMVNSAQGGVSQAYAFVQTTLQQLVQLQGAVTAQRQSLQSEESSADQEVAQATEELIRAPETLWPLRHGRVVAAVDRYVQASQAALTLRLTGAILDHASAVMSAIAARGRELAQRLAALEGRLQVAAQQLGDEAQAAARRLERRAGHPALAVIDPSYLETLYNAHTPPPQAGLASVLARAGQAGLLAWHDQAPEALAEVIRQSCQSPFEPILALTVEDVLAERGRATEVSPGARLAALLDEAQPAWNLDETRLPGGGASLRRITVVGVPDHTRSLFSGQGAQIVSIHDPHTVLALSMTVGAPYTALQAWPAYKTEYDRARRFRPLHVFPSFQREGQEAKLALALGLIFGHVFTRGVHVYYKPADELAPEERLAQGVANAVQALAVRDGTARVLLDRVEAHIEHIGTGQALAILTDYARPGPGDDDVTRELKHAVREYADVMRSNARLSGARSGS